jgi:hypothetical protein
MNEATAVDLTRWVGTPIAEATAALADHHVEVLAQPQNAGPFGPLATLASSAVRVFAGDQVIALVTAGHVAGFAPAPTGTGGLNHRVTVLERRLAALEPKAAPAARAAAAAVKKAPAAPAKNAPAKKAVAKKAVAKKAPAKKAPGRRRQG